MDHDREIDRLLEVEYGHRAELVFRFSVIFLGSLLLFYYTGWLWAFVWPACFVAAHLGYFRFLRRSQGQAGPRETLIAGSIFGIVLLAFLWMPVILASSRDPVLAFAGSAMLATLVVFLMRRADTLLWMILMEIKIIAVAIAIVVIAKVREMDTLVAYITAVFVTVSVIVYISQALIISRRNRLDAESSALRAAQEQKMAAIGRLAGGVAHDFNNVLAAIIGNLELSRTELDPSQREREIDAALLAAHRAESVVRHLLIYARKAPGQRSSLPANALVRDTMVLARQMIPDTVTEELGLAEGPLTVRVDESQFTAALLNLISNAVEAMPGGGRLQIETGLRQIKTPLPRADGGLLEPGDYVLVSVADTGFGIPEPALGKVIEPFYTTKPRTKGTGLGLPMVLGFAHEAGGGLLLVSSSAGTVATMYLPRDRGAEQHDLAGNEERRPVMERRSDPSERDEAIRSPDLHISS